MLAAARRNLLVYGVVVAWRPALALEVGKTLKSKALCKVQKVLILSIS